MSKRYRRGLSSIHDEAVDWVQKLKSGTATPKEIEAAERWRSQSPDHAVAFEAAEHVWSETGAALRALHGSSGNSASTLDALGRQRRTMNRRKMLGGGAAVIGAAGVYGVLDPPLGLWPSLSEMTADYRTSTGEQRNVTFADDVAINLNTQTSLAIRPATMDEDWVELIAGEAFFAAQNRAARSLVVLAANGKTVTKSGRFDVRYTTVGERPGVCVTCFEGEVRIQHRAEAQDLQPGQQLRYDAGGLTQIAAIDPIVESEWRRGIVEFRNTPLIQAIEEINRYRPGRVILMNKAQQEQQVNGRFRIDQMDKLLLQLEYAFDLELRRLPGGLVLLS